MNATRIIRIGRCLIASILALLCLSAANVPSGAGPGSWPAIGTASVTFGSTSTDWQIASQVFSDNGGNYSSIGPDYIQAEVWSNNPGASSTGYENCVTTFEYIGGGTPDSLNYTSNGDVTAYIGTNNQSAYAQEYINGPGTPPTPINAIDVLNNANIDQTIPSSFTTNVNCTDDGTVYTFTESDHLDVGAQT